MHDADSPKASPIFAGTKCSYFLWRRHERPDAYQGHYPEVIATNGRLLRRMICHDRQILFQEFEDPLIAQPIIDRIEGGADPGVALVGYSMLDDSNDLAILQTGTQDQPGWLAFPDMGRLPSQNAPTLPIRVVNYPKTRLVTSALVRWERRTPVLHVTLEEHNEEAGLASTRLLGHLERLALKATFTLGENQQHLRLCKTERTREELFCPAPGRLEAIFELDDFLYGQFATRPGFQMWLLPTFDRSLFCLPDRWNQFPIRVDPLRDP